MRDTVTSKISSSWRCEVCSTLYGPAFLSAPVFETENTGAVWVLVRAATQVTAVASYGLVDVGDHAVTNENVSLTHALPVSSLQPDQSYWFRVRITDGAGRSMISDRLLYPAGGIQWSEEFDVIDPVQRGWRDETTDPGFNATVTVVDGLGVVTVPAAPVGGNVYGKILSECMNVDLDQFPILEVTVTEAAISEAYYRIALQQEESPWDKVVLFDDNAQRTGTMILNVPEVAGWSGTKKFSVEVAVHSWWPAVQSISVDRILLRTDAATAWIEDFVSMRDSWGDEHQASFVENGGGTASLIQGPDGVWGRVLSELLVFDAATYPWVTVAGDALDAGAQFKLDIYDQVDPFTVTNVGDTLDSPFAVTGRLEKMHGAALDEIKLGLVIVGEDKTAVIDEVRVAKRVPGHEFGWDAGADSFMSTADEPLRLSLTATDYQGREIAYGSEDLPGGASYDGILRWTPVWPQMGTYRSVLTADNGEEEITRTVTITVTNEIYQLVAPMWSEVMSTVTTHDVMLTGTYEQTDPEVAVMVSVGEAGRYETNSVAQADGVFTWTGTVTDAWTPLFACVSNKTTGQISSDERCHVYYHDPQPQFAGAPFLETENETQAWMRVPADQAVNLTIEYGTNIDRIGDFTIVIPDYEPSHTELISPLHVDCDYWFQLRIVNADNITNTSAVLHYPAGGRKWGDDFTGDTSGWRDEATDPGFNGTLSLSDGQGVVTAPAAPSGGDLYAKILSVPMTVDLDQFPILEVSIADAPTVEAHYRIALQEEEAPWSRAVLFDEDMQRTGTMIFNIPKMTGWSGTRSFSVELAIHSWATVSQSIRINYVELRADANIAWQDDFDPPRDTWQTAHQAYLEDNGDGTATLRQEGADGWGFVWPEMLVMDMEDYPWLTLDAPIVTDPAQGASLKVNVNDQASEGFATVIEPQTSGFLLSGRLEKFGTNILDEFRTALIIGGMSQTAVVDRLYIAKRPGDREHMLYWDFGGTDVVMAAGEPLVYPFTATDYDGADVEYAGSGLPAGATYDGVLRWTPQETGLFHPVLVAQNGYTAITNAISITVTSIYTLVLGQNESTGEDEFPRAMAEEEYFTGAAAIQMMSRYLHGDGFTDTQQQIYDANTVDPAHHDEITASSCAQYLTAGGWPPYNYTVRAQTELSSALLVLAYWLDYLPPGGEHAPACILSSTDWCYKVVRGFRTDRKPYDGGFQPPGGITVHSLLLNDPKVNGLGHNIYVPAANMDEVFEPSLQSGEYLVVVEPPLGAAYEEAQRRLDGMQVTIAPPKTSVGMATYVNALVAGEQEGGRRTLDGDVGMPPPATVLPDGLLEDRSFMSLFEQATESRTHVVNADGPGPSYVLLAGAVGGPARTAYVLKLSTNGATDQVTWSPAAHRYLPVNRDAAAWVARRTLGTPDADLVAARLVYEPGCRRSVFYPDWEVVLASGGVTSVVRVTQRADLSGDDDADGMSDSDELYAGLDPSDPESILSVEADALSGAGEQAGDIVITWPSSNGRTFRVLRSTDLAEPFVPIAVGIPATPPLNTYTDPGPPDERLYYRVEVE
ncbi:MAG: hypothetical protein JXB04_02860 [Kiritimatiellae bacterium]|nr:hypothetical protein [Kiritimatiellia bacterium]